jgi:hypothetical protein
MAEIHVTASAVIPAPPSIVYGLIADYRRGHPSILPPEYFQNLQVHAGGIGAGTRITFQMRVLGQTHHFFARISEPEPGRRLVERYPETGMVTTFKVDPEGAGKRSRVTITTAYTKAGLAGWFERLVAPRFLRTVYAAELGLLELEATARMAGTTVAEYMEASSRGQASRAAAG